MFKNEIKKTKEFNNFLKNKLINLLISDKTSKEKIINQPEIFQI